MFNKDCFLDHVAVVVEDLDQAIKVYEDIGLEFSEEREIVESQGVMTAFAGIDGEGGPIHKYLEKKGPGIHHLCFKVPDIEAKCKELVEKGIRLTSEKPFPGANNCLVNFVHPKSTGGVLIEISQDMPQEDS
jgi:methylmalonyl-CoA/ethylmalonyl-CoA epimerase